MFRLFAALIATACALPCDAVSACGADLRGAQTIESARYQIAYRLQPAKIAVGRHFSVEFVACAKGGAPAPAAVAVDASMPEHGHGMNYKAVVKPVQNQNARYRADGLMFHMPGRWELIFEVQGAVGTERLTRSIALE
ncbi:MAG: FixH family protein [Betaproteobacteria bacterium]|nr:FixH family protein [Betaproteobacteria bacterium]